MRPPPFLPSLPPANTRSAAITGTWALPFSVYHFYLSAMVSQQRVKHDRMLGNQSSEGPKASAGPDPLQVAVRAHGNFVEHVPYALLLAAIAELNGAGRRSLNYVLAALFVARVAHVEFGLRGNEKAAAPGRLAGHLVTQGTILGLAGWSAYLIKGYWGF